MSLFVTDGDKRKQAIAAKILEGYFKASGIDWTFRSYNDDVSPLDWYVVQGSTGGSLLRLKVPAYFEFKCRDISLTDHSSLYISMRKYFALQDAQRQGSYGFFAAQWFLSGEVGYIETKRIKSSNGITMIGHSNPRAANDQEPGLHVPLEDMKLLRPAGGRCTICSSGDCDFIAPCYGSGWRGPWVACTLSDCLDSAQVSREGVESCLNCRTT